VDHTIGLGIGDNPPSISFGGSDAAQVKRAVNRLDSVRQEPQCYLGGIAEMCRPKGHPAGIHHYNSFATASLTPIQHVTGENPGVPGRDPIGPFPVNPHGLQVFSLSGRSW
jgi:hypothetical protein